MLGRLMQIHQRRGIWRSGYLLWGKRLKYTKRAWVVQFHVYNPEDGKSVIEGEPESRNSSLWLGSRSITMVLESTLGEHTHKMLVGRGVSIIKMRLGRN